MYVEIYFSSFNFLCDIYVKEASVITIEMDMLFQAYKQIFSLNTGFYTDMHGFREVSVWLKNKLASIELHLDHRSA